MLLQQLPQGSALARSIHGEAAEWSTDTHLLALLADIGAVANWQRTRDGQTGRNAPPSVPRPGDVIVVERPPLSREEAKALFDAEWAAANPKKRKKRG